MDILGRAWSKAARLRQRASQRRNPAEPWEEQRLAWVREHAPGRSFADIGGLFKLVGDIAFLAEESGATQVTLFDVGDPDLITAEHPEWGWFTQKKADRGSNVRYVQGDLEDPESPRRIGEHDLVFFSGVLYHTPNPVLQLLHLREITRELLYLSTLTIPEIPGFPQACVFYPYLDEAARRPYAAGYHWAGDLLGIGRPIDERPMFGFGNCYWGMTPSALRAMLRVARFEVVREQRLPVAPFATELVCRPMPLDPLLPPVTYFRERAEARERGEGRLPFETWYDEQRG
ncbi:MAG TPA: class I SAM-dependent methyltransferase [Acidimicrobiales bacterium]|nr:class I SAM-dependent methyltransferase [Acidimicrobiales bacterium]